MKKQRCVFFDRDGIVNVSPGPGYVERVEDFKIIPAFIDCARIARDAGCELAIVTNQRGVARGIMTMASVDEIHARLTDILAGYGLSLLGIYCCPHERDSCTCRKPQPGMLLRAAAEHNLDLETSWMIGDSETDVEAGRRAGCSTIRICDAATATAADYRFADMPQLAEHLAGLLISSDKTSE